MITYQEETYEDLKEEIIPLLVEHWGEIGVFNKEYIKLKPKWEWYKILADNNLLDITTARKDSKLIGYCIFVSILHIHHSDIFAAECDVLYLRKKYRKGLTGYILIKKAIKNIKQKVQLVSISMKITHLFPSILERLGFRLTDYKYHLEV